MRGVVTALAVLTFLSVSVFHVRLRVHRDALAYEVGRQHLHADRLLRRAEIVESRVRAKYDPLTVHRQLEDRNPPVDGEIQI